MFGRKCDNYLMAKNTVRPMPLSDPLRCRIIESGLPINTLAKATGIQRMSLHRFIEGQTSIRLDVADKLATYFGMRLLEGSR